MLKLNHISSSLTRRFVCIPFLVVFVTVFIIDNRLANGLTSGKYFWFYAATGLIAITAIVITVKQKKRFRFGIMDGWILLYVCILAFSEDYATMETTTKHILFVLVFLLFFYFRLFFQINKPAIYWLTVCFMLTGFGEAVWGLRQLYGYEPSQHNLFSITGSFFNPGPYACYVAVIFPVALYYMLKYRTGYFVKFHSRNIPIYILGGISTLTIVSSVLVLPATMSRASWIATIGGCGWVLCSFLTENKKEKAFIAFNKKKWMLIAFVLTLLIVTGGAGMYRLKKDSANGRMFIWKNTIELIKQNPSGVGIGNFSGSYGHVQAAYFEAGKGTEDEKRVAGNPEYAFNEYLQIGAEQGVVAFLWFIGIMGYSLYIGFKRKKVAPVASLIALLIAASASYPFSVLPFLIALVFLLAWIHEGEKGIVFPKPVSILLAVCCLVIVSLCLYNRYPTYKAYKKWHSLKIAYQYGNQQDAADEYRSLYPLLSDQIQFLFEYAQCLSKSEQYEESNKVLKQAVKISCDPMLYNVMGKNYQGLRQYAEAERCFLKASRNCTQSHLSALPDGADVRGSGRNRESKSSRANRSVQRAESAIYGCPGNEK